ncbi:MAG: hypothetical protein WDO16_01260 [Bacteroidota bacterium]
MKIYIDTPFEPIHKELLRKSITDDELVFKDELKDPEEQLRALFSADILLGILNLSKISKKPSTSNGYSCIQRF